MADFGVGAAVVGLFGNCLHAYRAITTAVEFGSDAIVWDVQMRIERFRFEIWARTLGFLDIKTGSERPPEDVSGSTERGGLGDVLQIEGVQDIVIRTLTAIQHELEKFDKTADKYRVDCQPELKELSQPDNFKNGQWWKDQDKIRRKFRKLPQTTKEFAMRLALVMKDPDTIKDLLRRLSDLNNGLEKVLSVAQRHHAGEALVSAVLSHYDEPAALKVVWEQSLVSLPSNSAAATTQLPLRPAGLISAAKTKQAIVTPELVANIGNPIFDDEDSTQDPTNNNRELPSSRVTIHGTIETTEEDHFWPPNMGTYHVDENADGNSNEPKHPPIRVIVEWRKPYHYDPWLIATGSYINFEKRRDLIVDLLHKTSNFPAGTETYRVLDCLGYIRHHGRIDGVLTPIIGFVSVMPSWADTSKPPVTLQSLLWEAFNAEEIGDPLLSLAVPSLGTRFRLARILSMALYQLHCSRWLHRSLTSNSIIFFYDRTSREKKLRLDEPYLIGLQYSRPSDDEMSRKRKKNDSERGVILRPSTELYFHPKYVDRLWRAEYMRYRKSLDVYSLGIILYEIAMWEPVNCFLNGGHVGVDKAAQQVRTTVIRELAAEVGDVYRDVVLQCLDGLRPTDGLTRNGSLGKEGSDKIAEENEEAHIETGLEVELYWKVVQEIGRCVV